MVLIIRDDGGREVCRSERVPGWLASTVQKLLQASAQIDGQVSRGESAKVTLNVKGESVRAEITTYC